MTRHLRATIAASAKLKSAERPVATITTPAGITLPAVPWIARADATVSRFDARHSRLRTGQ